MWQCVVINITLFIFYSILLIICGFTQYKKGYKKGYKEGYQRQEYDFAKWML